MSKLAITIDDTVVNVALDWSPQQGQHITLEVDGTPVAVTLPDVTTPFEETEWLIVDGRPYEIVFDQDLRWIRAYAGLHALEVRDTEAAVVRPVSGDKRVKAPIPGLITQVLVEPGQPVEAGMPVVVLEAMKMENEIHATATGVVRVVKAQPGETVLRGDTLVEIA
jgi:biotin carboxyl carrier protein